MFLLILEINQVISQETNISWEIISSLTPINFSQGNILKVFETLKLHLYQFQGIFNSSFKRILKFFSIDQNCNDQPI